MSSSKFNVQPGSVVETGSTAIIGFFFETLVLKYLQNILSGEVYVGCWSDVQLNRMALVTWSSPYVSLVMDSHFNLEETKTLNG